MKQNWCMDNNLTASIRKIKSHLEHLEEQGDPL